MGLEYYRDLLRGAVSDMACRSGGFNDRLLVAWSGYIYKFNWTELEAMLMKDDMQSFRDLKKRLDEDLHSDIEDARQKLCDKSEEMGIPPWTEFQLGTHANAETVIRRWHPKKAKKAVEAIIDLHNAVVLSLDSQRVFPSKNTDQGSS